MTRCGGPTPIQRLDLAPVTPVTLHNAAITLVRHVGWGFISDATRHYAARTSEALRINGAVFSQP